MTAENTAGSGTSPGSEMKTRILSAVLLAPVALAAAWAGGWYFSALLAVAALFMAQELTRLLYGASDAGPLDWRGSAGLVFAGLVAIILATAGMTGGALAAGGAVLAFALAGRSWKGRHLGAPLIAYPYLVLGLVALIWLRSDPEWGRAVIFWLLATVWAIDIFAYFAGRFIGGPKLAPRISPKKPGRASWAAWSVRRWSASLLPSG